MDTLFRDVVRWVIAQNMAQGYRPASLIHRTAGGGAGDMAGACGAHLRELDTMDSTEIAIVRHPGILTLEDELASHPEILDQLDGLTAEYVQLRLRLYARARQTGRLWEP